MFFESPDYTTIQIFTYRGVDYGNESNGLLISKNFVPKVLTSKFLDYILRFSYTGRTNLDTTFDVGIRKGILTI